MITLHFRRNKSLITLPEPPTATVPHLIAEVAEVLVETKLASSEATRGLRLAKETALGWEELNDTKASVAELGLDDTSIVVVALEGEDFGYEALPTFDDEE